MARCPHCGSTNRQYQESNAQPGEKLGADLTLLCLAPVPVGEESFDWDLIADSPQHQGVCGMQWNPHDCD
jgi:hypothetical protein